MLSFAADKLKLILMPFSPMLGADDAILLLQLCSRNSMPKGTQVEDYGFQDVKGRHSCLILGQKQFWLLSWPSHAAL